MKISGFQRIWNIIYPVLLYVALSDCIYTLLCFAIADSGYSDMILQILTAMISFPAIYFIYSSDKKTRKNSREKLGRVVIICLAAGLLSIALNNLISLTDLQEKSQGYQRVTASFFSSTLWIELFGTSVITPIVEETLYRGLVYQRLKRNQGVLPSILISAVIFGIIHFNLVQFVYAGLIGLFLALVMETEGKLYVPVLAHAVANAISVLRVETGFLSFMTADWSFFLPVSVIMLLTAGIIIWYIIKNSYLGNNL